MADHLTLKQQDRTAIDEFRQRVSQLLGPDLLRLGLFGSKATGQDTPESDIDVFVLVKDSALFAKEQVRNIAFDLNLKHGVYISPRIISHSTFNDPVWSQTSFLRGLREKGLTL